MSLSPLSKFTVAALLLGGSAISAQAEFQKYNVRGHGAFISGFWVDDQGRHVIYSGGPADHGFNPFTSIYDNGVRTDYAISATGVSSDGRVFGGIGEYGRDKPAYLDLSGNLKVLALSPESWGYDGKSFITQMQGEYTALNSQSNSWPQGRPEILYGDSFLYGIGTLGVQSHLERSVLFDNGNLLYSGPTYFDSAGSGGTFLVEPSGSKIDLINRDRTGILEQQRPGENYVTTVGDVSDNGLMLVHYTVADIYKHSLKLFNSTTGDFTDLYADMGIFRVNNNGDLLAGRMAEDSSGIEFWVHKTGEGWFNASQLSGMGSLPLSEYQNFSQMRFDSVDFTNSGHIYGRGFAFGNVGMTQAFVMNPVPEPGTMLLLAAGAGGLMAARRRKKQGGA